MWVDQGGGASEDRPDGVLTDAADTVAYDHDGPLISHSSTGHGQPLGGPLVPINGSGSNSVLVTRERDMACCL